MGMSGGMEFFMNKILKLEFSPIFVDVACNHRVGGAQNLLLEYAWELFEC